MSARVRYAHAVYADELFKLGYGYPLWDPEPRDGEGEVQVGDVGFLMDGGFHRLFSAVRDAGHPDNQAHGVPSGFTKFAGYTQPRLKNNAIPSGPLCSEGVNQKNAGGGTGEGGAGQGQAADLRYECAGRQGAMAVLGSPASHCLAFNTRRMQQYMRKHVDKWCGLVDAAGLDLRLEDIVFVRGWKKTTRWAVVAFNRPDHDVQAALSLKVGPGPGSAWADFRVDADETATHSVDYRIGPSDRLESASTQGAKARHGHGGGRNGERNTVAAQRQTGIPNVESPVMSGGSGGSEPWPADQCVFLHYFKAKRRLFWRGVMSAAAEPRDPSAHNDRDDPLVEENVPAGERPHDPVGFLLDYILEHSDASLAVASDSDLVHVSKIHDRPGRYSIPDGIGVPAFLNEVRPPIEVTDDGLGILRFDNDLAMEGFADNATPVDHRDDSARDSSHGADVDKQAKEDITPVPPTGGGERRGGTSALVYCPAGRDMDDYTSSATMHNCKHQFSAHRGPVCSPTFSSSGTILVLGGKDGHDIVWDVISGDSISTH